MERCIPCEIKTKLNTPTKYLDRIDDYWIGRLTAEKFDKFDISRKNLTKTFSFVKNA